MMREEKLYSAMYICGTALAIAFTMLIAEVYYVKTADIAPEVNRSKTYYLEYLIKKNESNTTMIYWDNFRDLFQKMQTPECVTAVMDYWSSNGDYIKLADGRHDKAVKLIVTEPGFFRFFQFRFTEGAPFTQDDFGSGRRNVVITEEIRSRLYPHLQLSGIPHLRCGGDAKRADGSVRGRHLYACFCRQIAEGLGGWL